MGLSRTCAAGLACSRGGCDELDSAAVDALLVSKFAVGHVAAARDDVADVLRGTGTAQTIQ